jgi:hypothetical protein
MIPGHETDPEMFVTLITAGCLVLLAIYRRSFHGNRR